MTTRIRVYRSLAIIGIVAAIVALFFITEINRSTMVAVNSMYIQYRDEADDSFDRSYWSDRVLYPSEINAAINDSNLRYGSVIVSVAFVWGAGWLLLAWRCQVASIAMKRHNELVAAAKRI